MYKILKFDRGRNCLRFLIQHFNIKEIYLPYYLCDVIRHSVFEEGCKPIFYHIDDEFMPVIDFPKDAYILYPNYFGICTTNSEKLAKIYPNLIVDNAHAYYEEPIGFASFNSGVKFGYGENAYLWMKDNSAVQNDISPTINEEWQKKSRNRFWKLHKTYSGRNMLDIETIRNEQLNRKTFCPFCYPLLAKSETEADTIVKNLEEEGYTIYRYWNSLPKSFSEYKFYSRLVPIPII